MNDRIESAAADWLVRRDQGLSAEEMNEFERWRADPEHAAALSRHEEAWAFVDRPRQGGSGLAMAAEIRRWSRRRRRWYATGGTLGALAIGLLIFRSFSHVEPTEGTSPAVVVAADMRELPDGSTATLRPGAEIVVDYTRDGAADRRIRLVRGEALFSVAARKDRPFIVRVDSVEVRALGTVFAVQRTDSETQVLVEEGRVAIERPSIAGVAPTAQILAAGDSAVVAFGDTTPARIASLTAAAIKERLSWRSARLEFSSTPLSEAIRLMNAYGSTQFEIEDPAVSSIEVSGFFRADNSEAFVRILAEGAGVSAERRAGKIVLRKAP